MKINIKFSKPKKSFKKHGLLFAPEFYWEIIIYSVFTLAIASFIFGYYFFTQINKETVPTEDTPNRKGIIKTEKLEKALEYFSERQKKSFEILNSPIPVTDPSI